MVTKQGPLSRKYIYTYIYQYVTQSGDRAIMQSYIVHQNRTGINCKYNQSAILNLSTVNKQNDFVIVNPNNHKKT